jgi:hypothetical protein
MHLTGIDPGGFSSLWWRKLLPHEDVKRGDDQHVGHRLPIKSYTSQINIPTADTQ